MGYDMADERIRDAFLKRTKGLAIRMRSMKKRRFRIRTRPMSTWKRRTDKAFGTGESIGGGKIRITRIDGVELDFTGEYATLIVEHLDKPGSSPI